MLGKLLAAVCVASIIAGCASVPRGDVAEDAALTRFDVMPEVAGVYIYCDEWMGTANAVDIAIDGRPFGQNTSFTFLHADVAPGRHVVTVKAENEDSLPFDAEAGHNYYVLHEVKLGWLTPRAKLQLVDEAEGRKGVRAARLATPTYQAKSQSFGRATVVVGTAISVLLTIATFGMIPPGLP